MRKLFLALCALALISCSRDPDVLKQRYLESGNKYYEQKRFKEASIMYRNAITKDKRFGPAYYKLGVVNLDLQKIPDAVFALRRAVELLPAGKPDSNDATLKLCEILLLAAQGSQDPERVVKEVRPMVDGLLTRNAASWEGHKLKGDMMLLAIATDMKNNNAADAKSRIADAIQEYRTSLASKPGDYIITLSLGRTLALAGEAVEAEALFKGLIDKEKTNVQAYLEIYQLYLGQRRLPEAEATLKKVIEVQPKDAGLRLRLAQFYWATQRNDDLAKLLNDMKKDLKLFPKAYFQSGDFYGRVNQVDKALAEYEAGIKADPDQKVDYMKRQIEIYIRQGDLKQAQAKNDAILKIDPKDPEAKGIRATFLLDKGQINEAANELQSTVNARPTNFIAHFNLGRALFAQGKYEQASQEFQKCVDLRSDYLPARFALTQVDIMRSDYDAAVHQADEILKLSPTSVQGHVMKAAALQRLNKYDEARTLLEEVLAKVPNQVEALLEVGILDLNQKKTKDAIEHFKKAAEAAPDNPRGILGESRALLADGQVEKSVDLIRQAADKTPTFDMKVELGNAQASARQFDPAISTFQTLLGQTSDQKQQAQLWAKIAQCYKLKGDSPKSIEFMEKAAKVLPDNAAVATNLALLYESVNDYQKSRSYYERAIKIDPNEPLALNNLAYLMAETNGDLTQALSYATRAQQKLPDFLEVSDTIGWIYLKKNNPDSAIEEFRRLVAKKPDEPTYHYHFAMALKARGDVSNAKQECDVALANHPPKYLEAKIHDLQTSLH